jgi:hypothetical protein
LISTQEDESRKETKDNEREEMIARLKIKKAWDTAFIPAKSIPMNAFMLYMSGNSIQIFSIMITVMLLWNSLSSMIGALNGIIVLISVFKQFKRSTTEPIGTFELVLSLKDSQLILPLLVYVLLQGCNLGLGIWKLGGMGLLPTATSDWLAYLPPKMVF